MTNHWIISSHLRQPGPLGWNEVEAIGKDCLPPEIDDPAPTNIQQKDFSLLYSVPYPDRGISYEVHSGIVPGRGRVSLIDRPLAALCFTIRWRRLHPSQHSRILAFPAQVTPGKRGRPLHMRCPGAALPSSYLIGWEG